MELDDGNQLGNIPTRPMRVKVLYTFDLENKTTCLARFPNTLDIPAVAIDDQSQVGVIELAQCIDAIIAASPEIVSKLDTGDFTIYAYDYSEYETPLVGQGRLSSLIASSASGNGPAQQNKSMITGRVCKNLPALFSNGVKETLEVKLRLTPVAQVSRREMSKMDEGLRGLSPATSAGFDPNAWNASIQHHSSSDNFTFDPMSTSGDTGALLEDIFGLTSDYGLTAGGSQHGVMGIPETPTNNSIAANPASGGASHSAPGSRSGSPMLRPDSHSQIESARHQSFSGRTFDPSEQSRCSSRASVRSELDAPYHHRQNSAQSQPALTHSQYDDFFGEDSQSRKRAKVTQADWHGRSSFGARSADLRVTAATASSMHMFRPIAKRAFGSAGSLDPPPRVPTPVPQRTRLVQHDAAPIANPRSMLRQASTIDSDFMSDADPMSDAMMSSPEGSSPGESMTAEGTPMDFPSSPPIVPRQHLIQPSSPRLPSLPKAHMADSGYMSEPILHSGEAAHRFTSGESQSPFADDNLAMAQNNSQTYERDTSVKKEGSMTRSVSPRLMDVPASSETTIQMDNIRMERPGDMNRLPRRVLLNIPPARRGLSQGSDTIRTASSPAPAMQTTTAPLPVPITQASAPQSRRGSLALPSKPPGCPPPVEHHASVPEKQIRRPLQRSRTNMTESDVGSPCNSDTESRPRGAARSGSAAPRRKVIERRLQESLAKGEMPEFCSHCGAIETPTWRKLYVKYVDGQNTALDAAEGEGELIGVQALEKDADTGKVTRFVIRKMLKKTKDSQPGVGFETAMVCNPCGLWFKKTKEMRPSEKWHKVTARRRKRQRNEDEATDSMEPESEAFFTDQFGPEDSAEASNSDENALPTDGSPIRRTQVKRVRSNSMLAVSRRPGDETSLAAPSDARAVQSSPVRYRGSQETPIELDLTPAPIRRLLFPSPRQAGISKSLEDGSPSQRKSVSPSELSGQKRRVTPSKAAIGSNDNDLTVFGAIAYGKENIEPIDDTDELAYLFESPSQALFRTPQRKSATKKSPLAFNPKTPTQSTQKRGVFSPNVNAANGAPGGADGCVLSPSSSRYFLRSTPSRIERTPGGRSQTQGQHTTTQEMTPFTRHLADMLNDAAAIQDAAFTSPSRQFDFTDLPTFSTPGREMNWKEFDEMLSSEFAQADEQGGAGP